MATIQQKLADSLAALKKYQDQHPDNLVIKGATTLGTTHTKRLVDMGYLQMVIKGWYIPSFPGNEGDSTVWHVSYWPFVSAYLNDKFGERWCLSAEMSLYLFSGKTVVPKQLIVRAETANNNLLLLPFGTSLVDIKASVPAITAPFSPYGIRLYELEEALLMASPDYYRRSTLEVQTCLSMLKDVSKLLKIAIDNGNTSRAGRVAGALRAVGKTDLADRIISTMKSVGYEIREENPFEAPISVSLPETSPYASRIRLLWAKMRTTVLALADENKLTKAHRTPDEVFAMMDERYIKDSYNSLSIEGYKVTEELLERVRSGQWNPEADKSDKDRKDALAARGYYQAYQMLMRSIGDVFEGKSAGRMYVTDHREWHFQLFEPCVQAGIVQASDLIGYRTHQVYIRNSMYTPLNPTAVLDAMSALGDLMEHEPDAFVRAVLGHFIFVYIHPYMDGNGRTARFLMNSQLVTAGYDWVVIPVEKRIDYMKALEKASVDEDIADFCRFVIHLIKTNNSTIK